VQLFYVALNFYTISIFVINFIHYFQLQYCLAYIPLMIYLCQAWATSGPRVTYGPLSTLMSPASYIWSFLNSYIDNEFIEYQESTCFITKTTLKSVYMDMDWPADT